MALRKLASCLSMLACVAVLAWPAAVAAQEHGIARIDMEASRIEDFGANLHVELALSRPVPWRVFTLDAPRRLVVDFSEVDFAGTDLSALVASDVVASVTQRQTRRDWSRLVIHLSDPLRIETAGLALQERTGAVLKLQLAPTSATEFSEAAGPPEEVGALASPPAGTLLGKTVRAVFGSGALAGEAR